MNKVITAEQARKINENYAQFLKDEWNDRFLKECLNNCKIFTEIKEAAEKKKNEVFSDYLCFNSAYNNKLINYYRSLGYKVEHFDFIENEDFGTLKISW